jgi:serine protease Do
VEVRLPGTHAWDGAGGSGVIASPDGQIVTNAHVARGADASIRLWDGRELPAKLLARDARRDLAALKVEAGGLPAAAFGDSGALRVGELVMAIGNPMGFIGALTTGVVHALGSCPDSAARTGCWRMCAWRPATPAVRWRMRTGA